MQIKPDLEGENPVPVIVIVSDIISNGSGVMLVMEKGAGFGAAMAMEMFCNVASASA